MERNGRGVAIPSLRYFLFCCSFTEAPFPVLAQAAVQLEALLRGPPHLQGERQGQAGLPGGPRDKGLYASDPGRLFSQNKLEGKGEQHGEGVKPSKV